MKFNTLYSAVYGEDCYPFHVLAKKSERATEAKHLTDPLGALVVWGGSDISPRLYNHPKGKRTHCQEYRDNMEWELMHKAEELGIPIIGVCRGAQMLCALAGGYLLQHVRNHGGHHIVHASNGDQFQTNSIHHQMMAGLDTVDHELLAWMDEPLSVNEEGVPTYLYKDDQLFTPPEGWKEPEFVYFPRVKGFAVQWHPEMMDQNCDATQYVLDCIKERCFSKEHA